MFRGNLFTLFLSCLLLATAAPTASALAVVVRPDRTELQLGDVVRVAVYIQGARQLPEVQFPKVAGCVIRPVSEGVSALPGLGASGAAPVPPGGNAFSLLKQNLAGAMQKLPQGMGADPLDPQALLAVEPLLRQINQEARLALGVPVLFDIEPQKTGTFQIPGVVVKSGGQVKSSLPIKLTVVEPRPQDWVRLKMSLSEDQPLVGQGVNLLVDVLVRRPRDGKAPHLPLQKARLLLPDLSNNPALELVKPLEKIAEENQASQGGFHLNQLGGKVALEGTAPDPDGDWYRYRLSVPLQLKKAGTVEIAAARSTGEVFVPAVVPLGKSVTTTARWETFVASGEILSFKVQESSQAPAKAKQAPANPQAPVEGVAKTASGKELPPLYEGPEILAGDSFARPTIFWVVCIVATPLGVALLAWGVRKLRQRRAATAGQRQQRQAATEVQRQLKTSVRTVSEVRQALTDFLRARFRMQPGEITPGDAERRLQEAGVEASLAQQFAKLMETCAVAEFAPGLSTVSPTELSAEAEALIRALLRRGVAA
jgi:hypothetical protein